MVDCMLFVDTFHTLRDNEAWQFLFKCSTSFQIYSTTTRWHSNSVADKESVSRNYSHPGLSTHTSDFLWHHLSVTDLLVGFSIYAIGGLLWSLYRQLLCLLLINFGAVHYKSSSPAEQQCLCNGGVVSPASLSGPKCLFKMMNCLWIVTYISITAKEQAQEENLASEVMYYQQFIIYLHACLVEQMHYLLAVSTVSKNLFWALTMMKVSSWHVDPPDRLKKLLML
jgi:hypothetical protein